MKYFWKKKTIVSYLLSVFVFMIHISSFSNYGTGAGFVSGLNKFASVFFKQAITVHSVTLFFILAGAVFFRNYDKTMYFDKLKSRIKTLLVPYLIWNIIWMLFEIITSYTFLSSYFIGREKFVLTLPNILDSVFHYGSNGPFWFMFELMFFVIITPVIDKLIENKYIGIASSLILLVLAEFDIGLPSPLFYSKEAISFYMLGGVVGKHFFEKFKDKSSKKVQLISAVYVICCFIYYYIFISLDIDRPIIINKLMIILLAFSFWNAMDLFIDKMKEFSFYSYSFAVFAMHINVSAVICKLYYLILPKTPYFALPNFILTLVTSLTIINCFCSLLKRFLPKVYYLLMGAR